jgi:nitrite reductase (NADH) small subunit
LPTFAENALLVTVADDDIVLFYHAGQVYALADLCVHKQRRLSRGLIFQDKAICRAINGLSIWKPAGPTNGRCQPTYAVHLDDDAIFIDPTPRVPDRATENRLIPASRAPIPASTRNMSMHQIVLVGGAMRPPLQPALCATAMRAGPTWLRRRRRTARALSATRAQQGIPGRRISILPKRFHYA